MPASGPQHIRTREGNVIRIPETAIVPGEGSNELTGAVRLRGPFTVNYNTPGVNTSAVTLTTLDAGSLVIKIWAFQTVGWVNSPGGDGLEVTVDVVDADQSLGTAGPEAYRIDSLDMSSVPGIELLEGLVGEPKARVTRALEASRLDAFIYVNGSDSPSAGQLDFYALIAEVA